MEGNFSVNILFDYHLHIGKGCQSIGERNKAIEPPWPHIVHHVIYTENKANRYVKMYCSDVLFVLRYNTFRNESRLRDASHRA
jgi:hypothetical protein